MTRWTSLLPLLLSAGCALGGEGADSDTPAPAQDPGEATAEIGQALSLGSYAASHTNSALDESRVAKFPIVIGAGATVMIGTDGVKGASNNGDTFLRLAAPGGDLVKSNHTWSCSAGGGSRLSYTSPYDAPRLYTLWAGCNGDSTCGRSAIAVSRLKGTFPFAVSGTNSATRRTENRQYHVSAGRWIRASTCAPAATKAASQGDTFLRLYRDEGGAISHVDANDDTNLCSALCPHASTIMYQAPSDGDYQIHVGCFGDTACSGTVAVYEE